MHAQGRLIEATRIVPAILPKDITGADQTGDWVKMTHNRRICILLQQGAWAGGDSAVTVEQATSNGGTPAAVSFTEVWQGTALTDDVLEKVTVASNTFNLSTANVFSLIEIHAHDLTDGYNWIRVKCASPGANADLLSATYLLYESREVGRPDKLPTVIA